MKFLTFFKNGVQQNYKLLLDNKMYKKEHNGSYFKYMLDQLNNNKKWDGDTGLILAFDNNNILIGCLILYYNEPKLFNFKYSDFFAVNIGTVGLYVKSAYRRQHIASFLMMEFESRFKSFYIKENDFVFVNTLEKSYFVAKKAFSCFIPCEKKNCSFEMQKYIDIKKNNGKLPYFK